MNMIKIVLFAVAAIVVVAMPSYAEEGGVIIPLGDGSQYQQPGVSAEQLTAGQAAVQSNVDITAAADSNNIQATGSGQAGRETLGDMIDKVVEYIHPILCIVTELYDQETQAKIIILNSSGIYAGAIALIIVSLW